MWPTCWTARPGDDVDPAGGGTHLFLASIVILAVNVVLVLEARDDTWTLDAVLERSGPEGPPTRP